MTPARTNQNWLPSIFNEFLDNNWLAERRNATALPVNIIEDRRRVQSGGRRSGHDP